MRKGRLTELLVSTLERNLNNVPNVVVESPKYLVDQTNGKKREHDVVLTIQQGHHTLLIGFECRDRKTPIGIHDVQNYHIKCKLTGIHQANMVSTSGYRESAMETAKQLSVRCLSIEEVEAIDWLMPNAVAVSHTTKFLTCKYNYCVDEEIDATMDAFDVVSPDNTLVDETDLLNNIQLLTDRLPRGNVNEIMSHEVLFRTRGCHLRHKDKDTTIPLLGIKAQLTYVYEVEESAFDGFTYVDTESSGKDPLAVGATARLKIGGNDHLVVLNESDNGVVFRLIDEEPG